MQKLSDLPNIGPVIKKQLTEVGIETPDDLAQTGSKQAWLNILAIDSSACYNRLCALEGAVRGIKRSQLPEEIKADLKEFYRQSKQ